MTTSAVADLWEAIGAGAARESPLWQAALLPPELQEREPVFSVLAAEEYRLGLETIYEGYLLHYGRPRLFEPADADTALLLGDYLYAHGLARIAALGSAGPVLDLAQLISLCAQLRGDGQPGDGPAWAATTALLGRGVLEGARTALRDDRNAEPLAALALGAAGAEEVERALAAHAALLG